jgi:hypothetical protein
MPRWPRVRPLSPHRKKEARMDEPTEAPAPSAVTTWQVLFQ